MLLDDDSLKDLAKTSIMLGDFFDNLDPGKVVFEKEELEQMINVFKIVENNKKLKEAIETIYSLRKASDSSIETKMMKRNILSRLFMLSDISNSYMNLSREVVLDVGVLNGDLINNSGILKVKILENNSCISDYKLRLWLEKFNKVPSMCKLLIIFENDDIIIFESGNESDFFKEKIVKIF